MNIGGILAKLEIEPVNSGACGAAWVERPSGGELISLNPATGAEIARVRMADSADYDRIVCEAAETFRQWRLVPAPKRGQIVREIGEELRAHKAELGALVTLETGKILAEGLGEVQEMIDMADFAVGLSRQLYGVTMASERPGHRMYEQWHPLGVAGVITAFNFPGGRLGLERADRRGVRRLRHLEALAEDSAHRHRGAKDLLARARPARLARRFHSAHRPGRVDRRVHGDRSARRRCFSFTDRRELGRQVATTVAQRLGRTLLELGGNNGIIVMDDADLKLALAAIVFGAVGTAGQRCTSTRRLFLQSGIAGKLTDALIAAYKQVRIGDPLDESTLMGPLINERAAQNMIQALRTIEQQGGVLRYGGRRLSGCFVEPAIVQSNPRMPIVREEVFAPILHVMEFEKLDEAIAWHNEAPQGLSSAIFTTSLQTAETFLSHRGSDCGIANVNIGTSGAEIGGAFGGEKETGGGREAGSDSWKAYMRRQTNTINWSSELPLAQGIRFNL